MKYKLICFDMDGVIFKDINFWMELHKSFGTLEEGEILTKKYLDTNYEKLVEEVVGKLWKGKDAKLFYELVNTLEYNPGVKEAFEAVHAKGYKTAIISASSIDCARRVQRDHGIDHVFANDLIIQNGKVAGKFDWPIAAGHHNKAQILLGLCELLEVDPKNTIYIGDSDKDIEASKVVGQSIAFNSDSQELKKVTTRVINSNDLSKIIPYL